ncbi:MAG: hypothetical protein JSS66_13550 [Armatimonadetes bacterium]|nr:hypothetical protein [Armatimonadota bacterium]
MRKTLTLLGVAAAAILLAVQSKPQLADKAQKFAMWFAEASTEFPDKDTTVFEATGNPVHGYSRDQNLEFSSLSMNGTLHKAKGGALLLRKGTMTGNVSVTVTDQNGTSKFTSAKASIEDDGETADVVVPGAFTFTSQHTGDTGRRDLTLTGTQATFKLKSLAVKDENPLVSATVSGPVKVTVTQVDAKGKQTLYTLTGADLTMRAEGDDKVVSITGGVHVTSEGEADAEHSGFLGTMDVSAATITMDKDHKIKKISTKGNPGTGSIRDKDGG